MLEFSIINYVCNWRAKYFRYGKESNPLLRCLSIGSFNAAFLADLVACYRPDAEHMGKILGVPGDLHG